MRLRRSSRRAADEKTAAEVPEFGDPAEEYIGVTESLFPGGGEEVWAADPASGRFQALPSVLAAILQRTGRFRTLEGHRQVLIEAGWQYDGSGYLAGAFRELIERGLLRSKSAFLAAAAKAGGQEREPPPIASLAWVTRDRQPSLLRCVESFAANLREHGRQADLAVYDDSSDPEERTLTRAALGRLARDLATRIRYAGEEEKRAFAGQLVEAAKADGVPAEVVEFALFDCFAQGYAVGANTNAVLLEAAGHTVLLVNDDLECRFAAPPWGDREGIAVSSALDPTGKRLFADPSGLEETLRSREADLLGAHQSLLGRSAAACMREQADPALVSCGEMTAAFARSLERGGARVRVTMTGLYGDSGMGYPVFALFAEGEARDRLVGTEEHYHDALRSRLVLRAVPTATLSDSPFLMAACCGLDHRELLPPFLPVLRNSDGLFGHTLRLCMPGALIGHLPVACAHLPPERREFPEGAASQVAAPRLADLLILLIRRYAPVADWTASRTLQALGETLAALARLDTGEFQALAREAWAAEMSRHVAELERLLAAFEGQPDFWAQDVADRIEAVGRAVTSEEVFAPSDLEGPAGSPFEAAVLAQRLIGRYGELLCWWPALVEAAKAVRSSGGSVSTWL